MARMWQFVLPPCDMHIFIDRAELIDRTENQPQQFTLCSMLCSIFFLHNVQCCIFCVVRCSTLSSKLCSMFSIIFCYFLCFTLCSMLYMLCYVLYYVLGSMQYSLPCLCMFYTEFYVLHYV